MPNAQSFLSQLRDIDATCDESIHPWSPVVVTNVAMDTDGGVISVTVERPGANAISGTPIIAFTAADGIRGMSTDTDGVDTYYGSVTFDLPTLCRVADDADFDDSLVVRDTDDADDAMLVSANDANALTDSPAFLSTGYLVTDSDPQLCVVQTMSPSIQKAKIVKPVYDIEAGTVGRCDVYEGALGQEVATGETILGYTHGLLLATGKRCWAEPKSRVVGGQCRGLTSAELSSAFSSNASSSSLDEAEACWELFLADSC